MAESPRVQTSRPPLKASIRVDWLLFLFLSVCTSLAGPSLPSPPSPEPPASAQEPADIFDHYLQWGLFDSLLLAVDSALTHDATVLAAPLRGRWHLLRGAAFAARQEWPRAKQDFVQAACLKTEARLDSLYVPAAMVRFSDSLRLAVVSQNHACPDMAANLASASRQPSDTVSQAPRSSRASWRVAGWVLGDLAAISLLAGAYSQWQAGEAYDRQELAGKEGEEEQYAAHGRDVKRHYAIRNASAGSFLIFGFASGYCFWRSGQTAQVAP